MRNSYFALLISIVMMLTSSCTRERTLSEYKLWLYSPESMLCDSVTRGNRVYSFTILPVVLRGLKAACDSRVTGLLRIRQADGSGKDVITDGIASLGDYSNRIAQLSFQMKDNFKLETGGKSVGAVGSQMPHDRGLRTSASIYVTFPMEEIALLDAPEFVVNYDDQVFGEGRMSWHFRSINLSSQPHITRDE